jgi:poly-gamma-glutamate synthesis protein (capsule biosynthesis protein)
MRGCRPLKAIDTSAITREIMTHTLILTGDINLLGIEDPAIPFRRVADRLGSADVVFGNLECCLYEPSRRRSIMADDISGQEGLYAPPASGIALQQAGYDGVGNANNQNYGSEAIMASNARLDQLGIAHVGTGENRHAARAPVIIERDGLRCGFLQRTSQYWPNNHEAGEAFAGVAALKAYTAYQPPYFKTGGVPPNRPGMPATVVTWTDPQYLEQYKNEISTLKTQTDIVVASHHWGYAEEILQYQREIAHAAIDAGADIIMGHGPHFPLALEVYRDRPIYYGLGMFCFVHSNKKQHAGWTGMTANLSVENKALARAAFSLVRQNEHKEIVIRSVRDEPEAVANIVRMSERFGTRIETQGDEGVFWQR